MLNLSAKQNIYYVLRLSMAMCFIGHGAFGIVTKPIWCNYFGVFGISPVTAYKLMPLVGTIDVALGIIVLFYPLRAIALWLVLWGVVTASLRPLSGEPFAELIERAGNFGAPLAFLILSGRGRTVKDWFTKIGEISTISIKAKHHLGLCLKAVTFLLLVGHGWLNLVDKKGLIDQYTSLGFVYPNQTAHIFGIAEIGAAFMVWIDAMSPMLLVLLVWKISTELFYPHYEILEFVERGGSYGALLSLWMLQHKPKIVGDTRFLKPSSHQLQ